MTDVAPLIRANVGYSIANRHRGKADVELPGVQLCWHPGHRTAFHRIHSDTERGLPIIGIGQATNVATGLPPAPHPSILRPPHRRSAQPGDIAAQS